MNQFCDVAYRRRNCRIRRLVCSAGFTILEVLVAIVVLGIGAIAVLSLQVSATKAGIDARYQTTALQLAGDLSAMMRSNPTVSTLSSNNPYLINQSGAPGTPVAPGSGVANLNSATKVAQSDIAQWYARVHAVLPGARAVVCFDETPYGSDGVPQWTCSDSGSIPYIKLGWSLSSGANGMDLHVPGVVIPVGVCNATSSSAAAACYSAGI